LAEGPTHSNALVTQLRAQGTKGLKMIADDVIGKTAERTDLSSRRPILSAPVLIQATFTIVFMIFVVMWYQPEQIVLHLGNIQTSNFLLALILLIANQLLSSVRFHLLLRDVGVRQTLAASHHINIMSVLGGVVLFNFFGQSLTRSTFLKQVDQSTAMAFILTGLERVIALGFLLILASVSALVLFGGLRVEFGSFGELVLLVLNLTVVTLTVTWFGIRRQRRLLRDVSLRVLMGPLLRASAVTLAMHAAMLGAYTLLSATVAPSAPVQDLIALSAIVMLAASMPISFAGWGVRELTAAYAFGTVGLDSGAGLTMAVAVGFLSLVALSANLVGALLVKHSRDTTTFAMTPDRRIVIPFTKVLCWTVPLAAAMFVVFQVRLPTGTGFMTVNLADPIVIIGALTLAALAHTAGLRGDIWRVPGLNNSLGVATIALSLAFLHGWVAFGVTDWALYNRLLGWLILICYLLTGALVTVVIGRIGLTALLRTYLMACCTVVMIELCIRLWGHSLSLDFLKWGYQSFYGMVGNPNAFGFQLVLALAIGLPAGSLWGGRHGPTIKSVVFGIILAGIWFAGSRASVIALGCLVALLFWVKLERSNVRHMMAALIVAAGIVAVTYAIINVVKPLNSERHLLPGNFDNVGSLTYVQPDRARSIAGGLEMFKSHPLLGAGLGAFMHSEVEATGMPLVIHSSYLWLLAEMGILGFLAFMLMPVSVLKALWLTKTWKGDWMFTAALGCLVVFAVMSLVHDMLYQRAFWLLAGATLALPKSLREIRGQRDLDEARNGRRGDAAARQRVNDVRERFRDPVRPTDEVLR